MTIPLAECKNGHVYKLHSRNLGFGVFFADKQGFLGIREKFGSRFLDMEYHHDLGPKRFGTAHALEDMGPLPPEIELWDRRSIDETTGRLIGNERESNPAGRNGWYFLDTGEYSDKIVALSQGNHQIFKYIENLENEYGGE